MKVKCLIVAVVLIFPFMGTAYGDPSRIIEKAMDTPASIFDVFLFEMRERWEDVMTPAFKISYDYSYSYVDNLLTLRFFVLVNSTTWPIFEGFRKMSEKEKRENLEMAMSFTSATATYLIKETPIRNGWATNGFDEDEFRKEIAKRTVVELKVWSPKELYIVVKDQHGKISVDKEKKK